MSIGQFDIYAGDYGKLDFSGPFEDTTADVPVSAPVSQKPVQNDVGISPITTQGAVSVQDTQTSPASLLSGLTDTLVYRTTPQSGIGWKGGYQDIAAMATPVSSIEDIIIPVSPTTSASRFGSFNRPISTGAKEQYNTNELQAAQLTTAQFEPFLKDHYGSSFNLELPSELLGSSLDWDQAVSYKTKRTSPNSQGIEVASPSQITALRSVVSPIVKRNIAELQKQNPQLSYKDAIQQSYANDPMLQQVYDQLGFSPYRQTDDGSVYWYDPVNDEEIRTFEAKDATALDSALQVATIATAAFGNPMAAAALSGANTARLGGDLGDIAKAAAGAYIGGQAAAGGGMFSGVGAAIAPSASTAMQTAISAGTAAGVSTAVQGGDLGDVVKSGLLGGAGGYVSGLGTEAASLEQAAQAAGAAGDFSSSIALTMQANQLTQQAGLIGTVANSAKALDAAASGDYVTALASGLNAAGTDLTKFTSDKITGLFGEEALANLNVDDVAAGVNKVATSLLDGKDLDDALKSGVAEYVKKGGSLGGAGDTIKDYLSAAGEGLYNDIIKPAGDFLAGLVDNVQSFDTPEGIKAIEDVVKQAGSAIDDTVLQPIKEGAEAIYEPLETPESIKAIEDAARTAGSAIEDATRTAGSTIDDSVIQPIREGLKDIDFPDVDFPKININLSGMFDTLMSYLPSQQQRQPVMPQQTSDPVLADLSQYMVDYSQPEELLASKDYLSGLLRTI